MTIEEYLETQKQHPETKIPAPAEVVMELRRRSGIGVLDAKRVLEHASCSVWGSRFLRALMTQPKGYGHLYDPIEDDADVQQTLEAADQQAQAELQDEPRGRGFCHRFWMTKERILKEEYGVEWFSHARMNPHVIMD